MGSTPGMVFTAFSRSAIALRISCVLCFGTGEDCGTGFASGFVSGLTSGFAGSLLNGFLNQSNNFDDPFAVGGFASRPRAISSASHFAESCNVVALTRRCRTIDVMPLPSVREAA